MQYLSLYLSYGTVALIVLLISNKTSFWRSDKIIEFESPWKEFGYVFLSGLGILGIGQLYMAGIRLPSGQPILEAINQVLIFSPAILLLMLRHKSLSTAWIDLDRAHYKILTGLGLAVTAILIYSLVGSERTFLAILLDTYSPKNFAHLVQVLCEDILIAMLFIRLKKATSLKTALIVVASLFAAGHIPAMISKGFPIEEFYSLFLDAGLGFFLIYTINKTKDILWFWMVHFAMDMMQFYA
jgi:hypothetical protein